MSRDSLYFLSHYELVSLSSMESAQCRETTFFKMQNVCVCRSIMNVCFHISVRYDTRCYFNVRSKADISQLNLPHGKSDFINTEKVHIGLYSNVKGLRR